MEASCPGTMCSTHPLSSYPLYLFINNSPFSPLPYSNSHPFTSPNIIALFPSYPVVLDLCMPKAFYPLITSYLFSTNFFLLVKVWILSHQGVGGRGNPKFSLKSAKAIKRAEAPRIFFGKNRILSQLTGPRRGGVKPVGTKSQLLPKKIKAPHSLLGSFSLLCSFIDSLCPSESFRIFHQNIKQSTFFDYKGNLLSLQ